MIVIKTSVVLLAVGVVLVKANSDKCAAKCDKTFSGEGSKPVELIEPCNRGCRLFSIHDATQSVVGTDSFFTFGFNRMGLVNSGEEETLNSCTKDCANAYTDKKDNKNDFVDACSQGCNNQRQAQHEKKSWFGDSSFNDGFSLSFGRPHFPDVNTNIFDNLDQMMARSRSYFPRLLSFTADKKEDKHPENMAKVEPDQQGLSGFHSMLNSVHQNVRNLMQDVLNNFNQRVKGEFIQNGEGDEAIDEKVDDMKSKSLVYPNKEQEIKSGGKMVVIRDGPGYHEEKTYNFGPNADVGKIFNNKMDDMMAQRNPLEQFFKSEDVEMIDPLKLGSQKEEEKEENKKKKQEIDGSFDIEVLGPFISDGFKADSSAEESRERNIGFNFDDWSFGPKLPETGLKTRPLPAFEKVDDKNFGRFNIVVDDRQYIDVCTQESHKMKWSDWISCLHTRLGLPRWLMAATVCLGIIFTLWICLVIPSNAPKQRVKKPKNSVGTKELEAHSLENPHLAVIALHKEYPLDLPPSYDDVTKTKVNLEPVHVKTGVINLNQERENEAGALPEKTPIPDESQA